MYVSGLDLYCRSCTTPRHDRLGLDLDDDLYDVSDVSDVSDLSDVGNDVR